MADGLNVPSCPQNNLCVYHLPVGQGDSTLIVGPNRKTILVDAGKDPKKAKKWLEELGVHQLNWVILTHSDYDHIGGFASNRGSQAKSIFWGKDSAPGKAGVDDDGNGIVDYLPEGGPCGQPAPDPGEINASGSDDIYPTDGVYYNGDIVKCEDDEQSIIFRRFMGIISAIPGVPKPLTGANSVKTAFNHAIDLGEGAKARIVVANGYVFNNSTQVPMVDTQNERSLGLYVEFGGFDYLVSGDLIGQKYAGENAHVEEALGSALLTISDSPKKDPLDALQVNHHGGNNASDDVFLDLVKPEFAIISVGKNNFGHPDAQTLLRLANSPNMQTIFMTNTPEGSNPGPKELPANYKGKPVEVIISNAPVVITTNGAVIFIEAQDGKYKKQAPVDSKK